MIQYIDIWWYIIRCHSFSSFSWFNLSGAKAKAGSVPAKAKMAAAGKAKGKAKANSGGTRGLLAPKTWATPKWDCSTNVRCLFFCDWRKKRGCVFFFLGRDFRGFVICFIRMSFDCLGWFWYIRLCFAQPLIQEWRALRTPLAFLIRLKQPDYLTAGEGVPTLNSLKLSLREVILSEHFVGFSLICGSSTTR